MSLADERESPRLDGFPRVSGDEPAVPIPSIVRDTFSPRERG